MDPLDPLDARDIVVEYARLLERDMSENRHPARVDTLPYAKPILKTAICTSVTTLASAGELTDEFCEYFETAYVALAEYIDAELVDLLTEYRTSADQLTHQASAVVEKTQSPAWRTLAQSSKLAGDVARAVTADADSLRSEFSRVLVGLRDVERQRSSGTHDH
jgi:predicted Zn-dependent protease